MQDQVAHITVNLERIRMNRYDRGWAIAHTIFMSIFIILFVTTMVISMLLPLFGINQLIGISAGMLFGIGAISNLHGLMTKYKLQFLLNKIKEIDDINIDPNIDDICNNVYRQLDTQIKLR